MGDESFEGLNLPPVEPWPEPVNGKALFDELRQWLGRFVVLPRWVAETVVLWDAHTYAFGLRRVSTYLGIDRFEREGCGAQSDERAALGDLALIPGCWRRANL